jgi:pilus assembly protein CpaC
MYGSRPGAALAPIAALIAGAAALALPGLGRAQIAPTVPTKIGSVVPTGVAAKVGAALSTDAKPSATPAIRTADATPARPRRVVHPAEAAAAEPSALHVDLSTDGPGARSLNLPFGKSAVVDLPADVRDVLVTNPAVADAVLRSRRRISVLGVAPGDTDAVFFDDAGKRMLTLDIHVAKDSSGLSDAIARLLPGSKIRVESVNDTLVLAGEVPSTADADKARRLAEHFVSKPDQVVSLLTVTGREQVMLKVRVVEVQRTIIKQLGFNMNAITGQLGMPQYSFGNTPTFGVNNGFMGTGSGGYALNTTSQPVAAPPFSSIGSGIGAIPGLAQSAGINPSNLTSIVSQYLTGAGAVSAAQQVFSQNFLGGLIGSVQTQVTPNINPTTAGVPYTVTAASAGINSGNIAQLEQAYLNGGALTVDQRAWLNTFNQQLPGYYNQGSSYLTSPNSTYVDRSNPANVVATGRAGSTGLNQAQAMLQAFERVGLVRTLAEPNLTAVSGEAAKFLAGGEFPVPTGEDTTGKVSLEFKPYGVGLAFTPVVMSEGRISLKISTEVSELSSDGAFTLQAGTGNTLVVPALKLRRTETTVELPSGGAMMISGLLQQQTKQDIDSFPGLANLPILGALFRSRDYLSGETELAIIITPYMVKPTSPDQLQTPIDGLQIADDMSTDLMGKINKTSKIAPEAVAGKSVQGPYGYVIE